MILDYEPGDKVVNPLNKEWGIGQVQSIIKEKVTVNFENVGINADQIVATGDEAEQLIKDAINYGTL